MEEKNVSIISLNTHRVHASVYVYTSVHYGIRIVHFLGTLCANYPQDEDEEESLGSGFKNETSP